MEKYDAFSVYKSRKKENTESYNALDRYFTYQFNYKAPEMIERYNSVIQGTNSLLSNHNSRFYDKDGKFIESYREDAEDAFKNYTFKKDKYHSEIRELKNFFDTYGKNADRKTISDITKSLEASRKGIADMLSTYEADFATMSKYKDAEDYKQKVTIPRQEYEAQKSADTKALKSDLDDLEKDFEAAASSDVTLFGKNVHGGAWVNPDEIKKHTNIRNEILSKYGCSSVEELEEKLSKKKQFYNNAVRVQESVALHDNAINAEDFDKYSWEGKSIKNPTLDDVADHLWLPSGVKKVKNKVTYSREYYDDAFEMSIKSGTQPNPGKYGVDKRYTKMTDEEVAIYNYYLAKEGEKKAEKYLNSIEESLNYRIAEEQFENIKDKPVLEYLSTIGIGLDQFTSGIKSTFNSEGEYVPPTVTQMYGSMIREDLAEKHGVIGQGAYDVLTTTGNLLPSILVAKFTGGLLSGLGYVNAAGQLTKGATAITKLSGAATMGASAAGNGYQEMINLGYDKSQAQAYGALVGVSEASLEYLIGGISSLGGKFSGGITNKVVTKLVSNVDNAIAKVAIGGGSKLVGSMISEFGEEYLQEVLNPVFKNITLKSNEDIKLFSSEALYSGILGALSAGLLEGKSSISGEVATYKSGKAIKNSGQLSNLKKLGDTYSADTVAYKIASQVNENTDAYTIGKLLHEAGADSLSESNINDIVSALEKKGVANQHAKTIAKWVNKVVQGEKLSTRQQMALDIDSDIGLVVHDILINPHSSINQRNEAYRGILQGIAEHQQQRAMDKLLGNKSAIATHKALTEEQGKSPTQEENPIESKFESNTEGKDFNSANDKIIASKKLVSSEKDNMKFEVTYDDGTTDTVDANDINFSNEGEALVYSAVMDMNLPVGVAENLIGGYKGNDVKSAATYVNGMREAFTFGKYNQEADLKNGHYASLLTEEQKSNAFKLGSIYAKEKAIADEKAIKGETKPTDIKKQEGKVHFEGDKLSLKSVQDVSLESLDVLGKALGKDIHIFESYVDENGKRVYKDANGNIKKAPNGFYHQADGSIWIDLNAGNRGQGTMLYTVAHELTHFIKQWSPTKFKALADFLVEQYGKEGVSVHQLVLAQQEKAKKNGRTISYDVAFEEMVADSMETMLTDGKVIRELAHKDKGLFDKIKSWIDNLLRKLTKEYKNYSPETTEGQMLREMKNTFEEAQRLFAEALTDASDNFAIRGTDVGFIQQNMITETGKLSGIMDSTRTETEAMPKMVMDMSSGNGGKLFSALATSHLIKGIGDGGAVNGYTVAQIREAIMKANGYNTKEIRNVQAFMKSMADFMNEAGVKYRFIGLKDVENARLHYSYNADGSIKSVVLSAMVKNGDYPVNFDFSSICKKRVAMSKLINKLCDMGAMDKGTVNLSPKNIFEINKALKNEGFETACLGCFVESKRYNIQEWANSFIKKWNEAVLKVNPNATYFGFTDGKVNFDNLTSNQVFAIDKAAQTFLNKTGKERRDKAKAVYEEKAKNGEALLEKLPKTAIDKIKKSQSLDDSMKDYFLSTDPKTFTLEDVNLLIDNEILAGRAISNKLKITKMVESGEQFQHLLRPSDLLTERGITQLEQLPNFHGILYGHYGSGTPKLVQGFTPYNSEIALLSDKKGDKTLAEYLYSIAGVRMQSFSDFQIQNIFDYLQMIADLSARKLPAHAYTKEISFAKLLGMTGIKTNLSVMFDIDTSVDDAHAGLTKYNPAIHQGEYAKIVLEDEQGKWVYNIGDYATQKAYEDYEKMMGNKPVKRFLQSIGFSDAVKLQTTEGYTKNCGIIGVGYSDAHILAMLDDSRIRYVIPYHSSSLPHEIKVATNIEKGTDYTSTQNTMKIVRITDKSGKAVDWSVKDAFKRLGSGKAVIEELNKHIKEDGWVVETKKAQNGHGTFDLYGDLGSTSDPRMTADNFMSWCAKNGSLPLFYQFADHNNYYKMLYDFNVYDNITEEYAPQGAVTNTYPIGANIGENVVDGNFNDGFFKETVEHYMQVQNDFNARLDDTIDRIADDIVNNTMPDADFRFSERESLEQACETLTTISDEDYLKAKAENPFVLVMNYTPQIVLDSMNEDNVESKTLAKDRKILIRRDALYLAIRSNGIQEGNYHGLGKDALKKLPKYLEHPDVILKTKDNDRRLVLSHIESKNGQAIISVEFESIKDFEGSKDFFNVIITVFDLHENYLRKLFKKNGAEIKYEKEDLEQSNPQLYDWLRIINSKSSDNSVPQEDTKSQELHSDRDEAPIFYSQMGKVVEGVKQNKLAANSVVNLLRGRGVKAEEIRWSGIVPFLEGKKSVTKQELLDFINGSMLQIEENTFSKDTYKEFYEAMRDAASIHVTKQQFTNYVQKGEEGYNKVAQILELLDISEEKKQDVLSKYKIAAKNIGKGSVAKWSDYKLDGGSNYREIVFTLPNSSYSNHMMRVHWGDDAEGVLVHARIQDFDVNGKKMLFIEEIQSDYHNEGLQSGYQTIETDAEIDKLKAIAEEKFFALEDYSTEITGNAGEWETIEKTDKGAKLLREYDEAQDAYDNAMDKYVKKIPDAPFKENYHEFVLKRLLRMAAEQGYDSIGWTPANIQSDRWSDEFAEAYRIEYDQEMPKFLRKYGRQWGAKVEKTPIPKQSVDERQRILKENELENVKRDIESAKRELARHYDSYEKARIQMSIDSMEKTVATLEQELSTSLDVWSMDITDSMKESVLYEGQVLYSDRDDSSVSTRSLLANALEGAALEPEERNLLRNYKTNLRLIDGEQAKLEKVRKDINEIAYKKSLSIGEDKLSISEFEKRAKDLVEKSGKNADDVKFKLDRHNGKYIAYIGDVVGGRILSADKTFRTEEDTENLKKLYQEAKQITTRITSYDRTLFELEAMKPMKNVLNREKALAVKRQKQKDAENLKAYKEKVAKTTRELLKKNEESRKKAIEGRNKTEMRHKVKKVVNDLNNLLLKPTKERHIPETMRVAVAEALDIVNMDTVDAETRVARYNQLIAQSNDPDIIASLTESRDRILEQGNKLGEKLDKLKSAYGEIKASGDDNVNSMYDDVIYSKIEKVQKDVGKTPLRNMTLVQLESVYELYKMVLTTVRDSNKAFAEDLKMTRQALGSNTFAEIKDNNKARDEIKHESIEKFGWKNLKPMQAMKTIGSGILQKLWNNVLYGQEVFAQDYDEAVNFALEMKDKYGYDKWDLNKLYSFESKSGKVMKINLEQMMSIYAYSKRKQADEHIEFGGVLLNAELIEVKEKDEHGITRVVKYKINDKNAYRLDKMHVGKIIDTLEKEYPGAKDFVDEMQKYLSETMGEKGNEVSMKMYGIKLFKEEHYFPLKSSKDFMEAANDKLKGDVKIKNKGMTKSTVEHAKNPIVLEKFLDVWGNHVNEMSMYHGLVLPLEDFSRTLNYGFKADDKLNTDAESVKTALGSAFGESAEKYLNELLKAINGGVLHDSSDGIANKMISTFKKSKVMASLSVIVQQPTAIIRAMGIIEPKYFVAQNFHHKQTWEELKKYCPTAIIKETGSFDTNMGRTIVDMIKEDRKFTEKVGDTLGKAPAYMDEMGWNMIWRALKNKVATEQKLSGEELLKECGKQMTLIINETQVYDSVMSRNELMRSKSAFIKMATAFMGEPTTVANMIYGAALDIKRGNKKIGGKTVAAVISSVVINGLVSSLVYALRDDDEEKTLLEKYLASATTEVLEGLNPLTYIPFVKDAYSLFQGYDVERTDMALIGDVYEAIEDFYNVLDPEAYEGMSNGEIAKHIYENSKPLLTSICDMFGLPVGNILRDAEAIIVNDSLPMSKTTSEGIGLAIKEGWLNTSPKIVQKFVGDEKYHKLYKIANNGDAEYVKTEVSEMVEKKTDSDTTEKQAISSVRSSFTSTYRDIYKKAYKNKDMEEMNRIRKLLYSTGLWSKLSELDSLLNKWRKEA